MKIKIESIENDTIWTIPIKSLINTLYLVSFIPYKVNKAAPILTRFINLPNTSCDYC